ncbi:MAG: hypothetical protein EWV75_15040 [Microcystis wesenbergii Mw_QC_S_20081001_S30D]|uniref:Uncharacterized protein n=1 Tax=Microcystis wesenbergii Mw_QC_S_20081001_S30D TaxID=2486245 RepID=A0A552JGK6_9CHRO|nr:MAG: hypothetical protein EWV75_15040 [Microcystis wesenbergii Mw_QC_S_20081001_S30D]TRU99141.1 MAG: hypothetical protein EWV74_14590 [Microcystis wesenbergii Mw_QC_S_20081001_S30]TRV04641.1 MAG: hypothetical protein EWV73_02315 [Microcystis wesenbergii Mw_QC_B_20070930_S4D]TRV11199.1 MAG: hypothetical protein EWV89_15600 [Microcystis wesenbergii Mw_QC_B_20070930_S4]
MLLRLGVSPDAKVGTARDERGFLPHTPHPTPHTPHPTPYTLHPIIQQALSRLTLPSHSCEGFLVH